MGKEMETRRRRNILYAFCSGESFKGRKEDSFCLSLREIIAIALDVQYSISSTWNERGGDDDDRW